MKRSEFWFDLPQEQIAQTPIEPRDHSRLLVMDRQSGQCSHHHFYDIVDYLNPGDLLVVNNSKVLPARIVGVKQPTGAVCELLPMGEDGIRAGALQNARASVLHITPFHSFPTGITTSAAKRSDYLSWAAERNAILIEDDFDSEFSENKKPLQTLYSMDRRGCVIYVNTFSHSLAPSMRMGYMVLPERLMEQYRQTLGFYSCSVPLFDQYVLARFISQGYFERHLNRLRRQNKGK